MQKNEAYNALSTRGKTQDDIFLKIHKSVSATVTIPAGTKIKPAEPLVSTDGGLTFKPAFLKEYDEGNTYEAGEKVVEGGLIQTCSTAVETAEAFDSDKWTKGETYVVNGAAMITFEREAKESDESFKCAVAIDCEISAHNMNDFNESTRVAGFPNILMR